MSNPEMNTSGQERAEKILKARQDAKKSEGKLREPTIGEVRERLRAIKKEVKDEPICYGILGLVLMAFEKLKD